MSKEIVLHTVLLLQPSILSGTHNPFFSRVVPALTTHYLGAVNSRKIPGRLSFTRTLEIT